MARRYAKPTQIQAEYPLSYLTYCQIPITEEEAQHLEMMIDQYGPYARAILVEFYERQGWIVLGHKSWREWIHDRFPNRERDLYRELGAGTIERNILIATRLRDAAMGNHTIPSPEPISDDYVQRTQKMLYRPTPQYRLRPLIKRYKNNYQALLTIWEYAHTLAAGKRCTGTHIRHAIDEYERGNLRLALPTIRSSNTLDADPEPDTEDSLSSPTDSSHSESVSEASGATNRDTEDISYPPVTPVRYRGLLMNPDKDRMTRDERRQAILQPSDAQTLWDRGPTPFTDEPLTTGMCEKTGRRLVCGFDRFHDAELRRQCQGDIQKQRVSFDTKWDMIWFVDRYIDQWVEAYLDTLEQQQQQQSLPHTHDPLTEQVIIACRKFHTPTIALIYHNSRWSVQLPTGEYASPDMHTPLDAVNAALTALAKTEQLALSI